MRIIRTHIVAVAVAMASAAFAQDVREEIVRFAPGTSGTTIRETIKGDQSVRYSAQVRAGQTMKVQLDTGNASNY